MEFVELRHLGAQSFRMVVNDLVRGVPPTAVATRIQREWGQVQDVSRDRLRRELTNLRIVIADCTVSSNGRNEMPRKECSDRTQLKPLLDELEQLAKIYKHHIGRLQKLEVQQNRYIPELSRAIKSYGQLIVAMQKLRFELGLDEYKLVKLSRREQEAAIAKEKEEKERKEDEIQRQIFHAVKVAEEIFRKRRITGPSASPEEPVE